MRHVAIFTVLVLGLQLGSAHGQRQTTLASATFASSGLTGIAVKNRYSNLLVLSNVSVQKVATSIQSLPGNMSPASTLLQKVGPYEVHKSTLAPSGAPARVQGMVINGQAVPAFAEAPVGANFVGAAYLDDIQQIGLISKEIVVKFRTPALPAAYASMAPKPIGKATGVFILSAGDVYAWLELLTRLQADPQAQIVEPQIVTQFQQPQ